MGVFQLTFWRSQEKHKVGRSLLFFATFLLGLLQQKHPHQMGHSMIQVLEPCLNTSTPPRE